MDWEVVKMSKAEVRRALKKMKSGKVVGPDDGPVGVWKCLGEVDIEFMTRLFDKILEGEMIPEEWRSVMVSIFKNKGGMQNCGNYRRIKLMSHMLKLWERAVEGGFRTEVSMCEQQDGFMLRNSPTDAVSVLRMVMEKYGEGQEALHCVFVDAEKACDRVSREELWFSLRRSGVAEVC